MQLFSRARKEPEAEVHQHSEGSSSTPGATAAVNIMTPSSNHPDGSNGIDKSTDESDVDHAATGGSFFKRYVARPCRAVLSNAELLIWVLLFVFVVFVVVRHRSPPTKQWSKIAVHKGLDHETAVRREALGLTSQYSDGGDDSVAPGKQHDDLGWHGDKDFLDQHDPNADGRDKDVWESQQHVDLDHVPTPDWKRGRASQNAYGDDVNARSNDYTGNTDDDPDVAFERREDRRSDQQPWYNDADVDAESKRLSLGDNDQYPYSQYEAPAQHRRRAAVPAPLSLSDIKKHIRRLEMNEEFSLVKLRLKELEELKKQRQRLMDEYDFADEQDAFRDREREWQRMRWNEQEKKFHRWLQRARMQHDVDDMVDNQLPKSKGRHLDHSTASTPESCPGMFPVHPFVPYGEHSRTIAESTFAYVTYVSSAEFVPAAATLLHSIAVSGSQYARAVVITDDISESDRATLSLLGQIIVIEKIASPRYIDNPRYRETFTKLRVWELAMFTRILYIDTDVVVTKNMDDLFDIKEWAVPMDAEQHRYSTGMMVCDPSLKTFDAMMKDLQTTTTSMELPDLLFLKAFFDNPAHGAKISIIPRWYQVYQEEFGSQYQTYLTNRKQKLTIFDPRIHGIHYPGAGKPWGNYATKMAKYQPHFCNWQDADVFQYEPQFLWYVHHEMMLRSLTKAKSSSLFEYESAGKVIVLRNWVEDKKKKDEEDSSWKSRNSWSWNSAPSYGKSSPYGKSASSPGYSSNGNNNNKNYDSSRTAYSAPSTSEPNAYSWVFRDNRWVKVPSATLAGSTGGINSGPRSPSTGKHPFVVKDSSQLWLPTPGSCRFVLTNDAPRVLLTQGEYDAMSRKAASPAPVQVVADDDNSDLGEVKGTTEATGNFWGKATKALIKKSAELLRTDVPTNDVSGDDDPLLVVAKDSASDSAASYSTGSDSVAGESPALTLRSRVAKATNRSSTRLTTKAPTIPPVTIDAVEDALRRKAEGDVRKQMQRPAGKAYQDTYRKGVNPYAKLEEDAGGVSTQRRLQQLDGGSGDESPHVAPTRRRHVQLKKTPPPSTEDGLEVEQSAAPSRRPDRRAATTTSPMDALIQRRRRRAQLDAPTTDVDATTDMDAAALGQEQVQETRRKRASVLSSAPAAKVGGTRVTIAPMTPDVEVVPSLKPSRGRQATTKAPPPLVDDAAENSEAAAVVATRPLKRTKPHAALEDKPTTSAQGNVDATASTSIIPRKQRSSAPVATELVVDTPVVIHNEDELHNPPPKRRVANTPSPANVDADSKASSAASGSSDAHFLALLLLDGDKKVTKAPPVQKLATAFTETIPVAPDHDGAEDLPQRPIQLSSVNEVVRGAAIDFSLVPPLVVSLPQEWTASPSDERYEWVVSWCSKTKLRPIHTTACGKAAYVSQYSIGLCRTNFDESFEVLPLYTQASTQTGTPPIKPRSVPKKGTFPWNATVGGDAQLVESFAQGATTGLAGVVFRSKVTLDAPLRAKWFEVAVRCDAQMPQHTAALDTADSMAAVASTTAQPSRYVTASNTKPPMTSPSLPLPHVEVINAHPPHDRRYRLKLRSRCACLGGCDASVNTTLLNATLRATLSKHPENLTPLKTKANAPLPSEESRGRFSFYAEPTPRGIRSSAVNDDDSGSASADQDETTRAPIRFGAATTPSPKLSTAARPTPVVPNVTTDQQRFVLRTFEAWKRGVLEPFGGLTADEACAAFGRNVENCLASSLPLCDYGTAEGRCRAPVAKWYQLHERGEGRYCNCTHVGGDAERRRDTVEECIEEAHKAGANVVNYVVLDAASAATNAPTQYDSSDGDEAPSPKQSRARDNQQVQRQPSYQSPRASSPGTAPKKTSFGCFFKKCSVPMLWSGRVDTAEYQSSGPTDGLTGFDVHVLNLFA